MSEAAHSEDKITYPAGLGRSVPAGKGSNSAMPMIDLSDRPEPIKNLIRLAAREVKLPNCDTLLYHAKNSKNWKTVVGDVTESPEYRLIDKASRDNALIWQSPKQDMTFFAFGTGGSLDKEYLTIKNHVDQGHDFSTFIYADVNTQFNNSAIKHGRKIAKDLGLTVEHVGIQGDIYTKEFANEFGDVVNPDAPLIMAAHGFTFLNLPEKVSGIIEAVDVLTESIKTIKHFLPKGSRIIVTFDTDTDRDSVMNRYTGEHHDKFIIGGIAANLGKEITEHGKIQRRFAGKTAILNRDFVTTTNIAVHLGNGEIHALREGVPFWTGISAKAAPKHIMNAFEGAQTPMVFDPLYDNENSLMCVVANVP
jgi:hypothetical protein